MLQALPESGLKHAHVVSVAEQLEALVAEQADSVGVEIEKPGSLAVLLTCGHDALHGNEEIRMLKLS